MVKDKCSMDPCPSTACEVLEKAIRGKSAAVLHGFKMALEDLKRCTD